MHAWQLTEKLTAARLRPLVGRGGDNLAHSDSLVDVDQLLIGCGCIERDIKPWLSHLSPSWLNRVSNTAGDLLEIYKVSWKFSGLVCEFIVNVSYNSCISAPHRHTHTDTLCVWGRSLSDMDVLLVDTL